MGFLQVKKLAEVLWGDDKRDFLLGDALNRCELADLQNKSSSKLFFSLLSKEINKNISSLSAFKFLQKSFGVEVKKNKSGVICFF